jgi:hypothetical protein
MARAATPAPAPNPWVMALASSSFGEYPELFFAGFLSPNIRRPF